MGTNKVGENIKKLRTESGLSQKEVAQAIGRSESQIGAYENGSVDMPLSVLFKIAACLKCTPEELITGKQKKLEKKWDAELKIFHQQDRLTMIQILAKNGYEVGQNKRYPSPDSKTLSYYVHATLLEDNADTSRNDK